MKSANSFWKYILQGFVAIAIALLAGCESDRDTSIRGVRFTNESSHEVTVYYGREKNKMDNTFALQPGNKHDLTEWAGLDGTFYYRHRPADKVIANEVASNHVIFTDAE